jgi:tetratricopeptide (TPR) repeat protein
MFTLWKSSKQLVCRSILITLSAGVLGCAGAAEVADNDSADGVAGYVEQAETALANYELHKAATAYVMAAEASSNDETARRATHLAYDLGFSDEALRAARRWAELAPNNDEALLYLGQLQLRDGQLRQAEKTFRQLLKRSDTDAAKRLLSFVPFLSQEDSDNANKLMRKLAKPYKTSADAQYAAGLVALDAGQGEEAGERALKALALRPDWLSARLLRARSLLIAGDIDAAIQYSEHIVGDSFDPDPDARLELALMYLAAEREEDALSQINQVLMEQPGRPDALRLMALINYQQDNIDIAWNDFQDLLNTGHHSEDAFFYLGRIADERGEAVQAVRLLMQVDKGPNVVAAQKRVGGLLVQLGRPEDAIEHFTKVSLRQPAYALDMLYARGQVNAGIGNYADALADFDRVVINAPGDEGALLGRAELKLRLDNLDGALADYRLAAKRFPNSALVLNALGYTLADRTEEFAEAYRAIKRALELDPRNPAIIDSYGWVLFKQGKYDEALAELERAYQFMKDAEIAAHIIDVLWAQERPEDAMAFLAQAEVDHPDDPRLEALRERLFPDAE